jgi:hypothetical protein
MNVSIPEEDIKQMVDSVFRSRREEFGNTLWIPFGDALDHLVDKLIAIAEVMADQAASDARLLGDLLKRYLDPILGNTAGKGGQNLFAPFFGHAFSWHFACPSCAATAR